MCDTIICAHENMQLIRHALESVRKRKGALKKACARESVRSRKRVLKKVGARENGPSLLFSSQKWIYNLLSIRTDAIMVIFKHCDSDRRSVCMKTEEAGPKCPNQRYEGQMVDTQGTLCKHIFFLLSKTKKFPINWPTFKAFIPFFPQPNAWFTTHSVRNPQMDFQIYLVARTTSSNLCV